MLWITCWWWREVELRRDAFLRRTWSGTFWYLITYFVINPLCLSEGGGFHSILIERESTASALTSVGGAVGTVCMWVSQGYLFHPETRIILRSFVRSSTENKMRKWTSKPKNITRKRKKVKWRSEKERRRGMIVCRHHNWVLWIFCCSLSLFLSVFGFSSQRQEK